MQSANVSYVVEVTIESQDPFDTVVLHHRQVKRVPSREVGREHDLLGGLQNTSVQ